jgi:xylitol oxidase
VTNWAGNIHFAARAFHTPATVGELRRLVAASNRVRVLGSGHSFNRIADTSGDQISVSGLPQLTEIDTERQQARVSAGARYGAVAEKLNDAGLALPNMGSLPHISVAGACATGTHGSGQGNQILASSVIAMEFVTATGDVITIDAGSGDFPGAVLSLGALGVATQVTLQLVPAFQVQQFVYENFTLHSVLAEFEHVMAAAYSVSVFTDLRAAGRTHVWLKHRVEGSAVPSAEPAWLDGQLARVSQHPLPDISAVSTTEQLGIPGPWNERLPHFRLDFTPSSGEELQAEYFVPRQQARAAIEAVAALQPLLEPLLLVCELRSIAADRIWLSPSYGRDTVAIHFTLRREPRAVNDVLAQVELALAPFQALPHWGKVFVMPPKEIRGRYERFGDFARVVSQFDPDGKFRNAMLEPFFAL